MPGFVTHYLFGVDTYKHLDDASMRAAIRTNHGPYSLGLQGPDVFFYYLPSHKLHPSNIGEIAHSEKTGLFFRNLMKAREAFTQDAVRLAVWDAYVMGFLGHYTLDCTSHPFVYAFTGYDPENPPSGKEYFSQHAYLETELDNDLLMELKQVKPSDFHQHATIYLTALQREVIAEALSLTYNMTWPDIVVTKEQVRSATFWMYNITRYLMHDPTGLKKTLVRKGEGLFLGNAWVSAMIPSDRHRIVEDPLNLAHRSWIHPWTGQSTDETFGDLFHKARAHYISRLAAYKELILEDFPWEKTEEFFLEYGDCSFSSGLPL